MFGLVFLQIIFYELKDFRISAPLIEILYMICGEERISLRKKALGQHVKRQLWCGLISVDCTRIEQREGDRYGLENKYIVSGRVEDSSNIQENWSSLKCSSSTALPYCTVANTLFKHPDKNSSKNKSRKKNICRKIFTRKFWIKLEKFLMI